MRKQASSTLQLATYLCAIGDYAGRLPQGPFQALKLLYSYLCHDHSEATVISHNDELDNSVGTLYVNDQFVSGKNTVCTLCSSRL